MKISFLGGADEIGASCTLLEVAGKSFLIDCGVRFKTGQALPDLNELTGKSLGAILITHAHTDHTGALSIIHEAFPNTPIYTTPPSADLISILQKDALHIMEQALDKEGEIPLYSKKQVENMLSMITPIHWNIPINFDDIKIMFFPASHILGASMVYVASPDGNILFTGDYSITAQKTVPGLDRPNIPVDIIISESTYGNRLHEDRKAAENRLINSLSELVKNNSRILIPAFAIGRAQEIILIIKQAIRNKKIPEVPVFVDGMVRSVCNVYSNHPKYVSRALDYEIKKSGHPFFNKWIKLVKDPKERVKVLETKPSIIVTSSGMMSGGPSAFYAEQLLPVAEDAILITGYQDEESPGRALLNLAESDGDREIKVGDKTISVKCHFAKYGLSAHADRIQMVGFIGSFNPRTTILVHGDKT